MIKRWECWRSPYKTVLQPAAPGRRTAVSSTPRPCSPDQDPNTLGDQSDNTSRKVAENTKTARSIGPPVSASDDDGDLLIYALGGADAAAFDITRTNGQLKTRAALDYETKSIYVVEVTATDPAGAADSIMVTISVNDVNDPAEIAGGASISYLENGTGPVAAFSATDQDGDPIVWSLSGNDAELFTIDGGVLEFKKPPDYENPKAMVTGGTPAEKNRVQRDADGLGRHAQGGRKCERRRRAWGGEAEQASAAGKQGA